MTLTTIRRLVLAGNAAALLAAGASAWHAFELDAKVRPPEEWKRIFPVKAAGVAEQGPGLPPLDRFLAAARWPQGEKPVEKVPETAKPVAPPIPPFQTRYELIGVFGSEGNPYISTAQLRLKQGADWPFSVFVGERIPAEPGNPDNHALTEWCLDRVRPAAGKEPAMALFKSFDTGEEQVLTSQANTGGDLLRPGDGPGKASDLPGGRLSGRPLEGAPDREMPLKIRLASIDKETGNRVYEVPAEEIRYLGFYSDDVVGSISTEPSTDAQGKADGFVLKAVPASSRPAQAGFRQEDKVISVNGVGVTSKENAINVGKSQYDQGTRTFVITVLRQGKEMNFTYRAPPK